MPVQRSHADAGMCQVTIKGAADAANAAIKAFDRDDKPAWTDMR
jgi:hypothetical protein